MGRTLSILLVLVGFTVIAPPAHAAVSVTISVSEATLSEGEAAVFSGKALGAKPGSVVELQRKTEAGWETVKTRTVWSTREYRFKTAPPRGYHRYRVLKPRQLGQAAASSPRVQLTVQWTPTLAAQVSLTEHYSVRVNGSSTELPEWSIIRREVLHEGAWYFDGYASTQVRADGTFIDEFLVNMDRRYRYTVEGEGLRLQVSSNEFEFTELPDISVSMNTTTGVFFPPGATERTLHLHLIEGQSFTFHARTLAETLLIDPSGEVVPEFRPDTLFPFTMAAPTTGDYAIKLRRFDASEQDGTAVTVSTPLVINTSIDDPGQDISTNLPGQMVDLVFAAEGGSLISEYSADYDRVATDQPDGRSTLLDPDGALVEPWRSTSGGVLAWRLPEASGTYTVRITPTTYSRYLIDRRDQAVLAGREGTMTVDGAPAHMSLDRPGRVGEVTVTVPAGLDMLISDTGRYDDLQRRFVGPDGRNSDQEIEGTAAGTYSMFAAYSWWPMEVDFYASTPVPYDVSMGSDVDFELGPAPARRAQVRIPVTAGEWFSFEILDKDGGLCPPRFWIESGLELLTLRFNENEDQPGIFKVAQSGDLVLTTVPCTSTGTFRLGQPTFVQSVDTGTTTDDVGNTTTTSSATLEATTPGQVMVLEYDVGGCCDRVDISGTRSSFPPETRFALSYCAMDFRCAGAASDTSAEILATRILGMRGASYLFVYAGPSGTGVVDLALSRYSYN